jgi:diguanylate cyclase (GGDEF)-like protein
MSDDFLESTQEVTVTTSRDALVSKATRSTGKAMLIVLVGGRRGERAILGEKKFVLGRGSSADLVIESDAVSRAHAYIELRDGRHWLVDNDSTNGSYVNYGRIKERMLHDGDQIQIGHAMMKYLSGDNIETAYHEEFRRLARRDALTGALNRTTYEEEVRVALATAERKARDVSLILFDLDHFKKINDTHGHTAGDLVLSHVGEKMRGLILEPHLFARVGGEEFAVLYHDGRLLAEAEAERIREAIEAIVVDYDGTRIPVTASFGVAQFLPGQSASDLYDEADAKLYAAKKAGRNCVRA